MRKLQLLIPAGSLDVLKTAVLYGADAVYLGGEAFGLRAKAKNFTNEEIKEGIAFAHERGVKVYITANIFAHNDDLAGVEEYFTELKEIKPDALIISDPGVFEIARRILPEMEIHISTQANNTNYGTFLFWYKQGAKRVVTARELSLKEIREIREHIPEDMEIESFIHGAMCISYSGRCLLSNFLTGRDANQGACTHPCRWKYAVAEMVEAGIDSFKIEGRMKTALYVATVARTYRIAIDDYLESPEKYQSKMEWYKSEIRKCTHREYITGFYFHKPGTESQVYGSNTYVKPYTYLGTVGAVRGDGLVHLEQKNKFSVGETIEIMKPDGRNLRVEVKGIFTEDGTAQESAPHPKQQLWVDLGGMAKPQDILRREDEALDL